jgi:hypothetical protein
MLVKCSFIEVELEGILKEGVVTNLKILQDYRLHAVEHTLRRKA